MSDAPTTVISKFADELGLDDSQEVRLARYWKSFVGRLFLMTIALTVAAVARNTSGSLAQTGAIR